MTLCVIFVGQRRDLPVAFSACHNEEFLGTRIAVRAQRKTSSSSVRRDERVWRLTALLLVVVMLNDKYITIVISFQFFLLGIFSSIVAEST